MKEGAMNTKMTVLTIVLAALIVPISWQPAIAQGCAGDPACIEIAFGQEIKKAPKVEPTKLWVKRKVREALGRVRFVVMGDESLEYATIKFKCRDGDKFCTLKSPFIDSQGKELKEFNVNRAGIRHVKIADYLPDCDYECALTDEKCIEKRCSYHYSIYNHKGDEVLDPTGVMEPR